jgi:uncharacterized protein (DUF1697 family)
VALVVLLRGVNVGGHRTFRPSVLARELSAYDVVNVGAAGTFVVRKPGPRAQFRAALLRKLPFATHVAMCDGNDVLRLVTENPFGPAPAGPDVVRFVSFLSEAARVQPPLPVTLPPDGLPPGGQWLVRIVALNDRIACGEYRRHMKTIGYLGQIDKLFGVPATTRNWNTVNSIVRILSAEKKSGVNKGASR